MKERKYEGWTVMCSDNKSGIKEWRKNIYVTRKHAATEEDGNC